MQGFIAHYIGLFDINHEGESSVREDINTEEVELKEWLITLLRKIIDSNGKEFRFSSDSVEVFSCIKNILNGDIAEPPQKIADRLLRKEIAKQKTIGALAEIQRGSLLVLHFNLDNENYFLLAKVDLLPILDRADYRKHIGLPYEKHIFKTCLIGLDDENQVNSVLISDNVRSFSDYWWQDFLETEEKSSDQINTSRCFESIDRVLKRNLLRSYKSDYTELRNDLIGYFRTTLSFDINDFISKVIDSYNSENKDLDLLKIKKKIIELPEKFNFDTTFKIERSEITGRFRRTVKLSDTLELRMKSNIENLNSVITAYENNGRKYIIIETEEGYYHFKSKFIAEESVENEKNSEPAEAI